MNTIKIDSKNCKMVAHRGVSKLERENTCPAFIAAGNRSYFGIETDIHVTKDGKFVVIHDESTKRVSFEHIDIDVEKNDYSAVQNIVLPDIDGSTVRQDIRIPLLEEYISICKKYEKKCVLEVKNRFAAKDLRRLVREIKSLDYLENVIFISFDFRNCTDLRKISPDSDIQWLTSREITDADIEKLIANNLNLDIYYKQLTKSVVNKLHDAGIEVNCWTCDDPDKAKELIDMGVDYITTNILE